MSKRPIRGTYRQTDPRYGRLESEDGTVFFVGSRNRGDAFDGDGVEAVPVRRAEEGRDAEAKIVKILRRGPGPIFGILRPVRGRPYAFVETKVPEGARLFVPMERIGGARDGETVSVRVEGFGAKTNATVTERIGRSDDVRTEREILVRESGIPTVFPERVLSEASRLSEDADSAPRRRDLSDRVVITIDGADAKDLDDAISVERLGGGRYELGVHIADVAEYVRAGSPLDREAFRRGTSCYLSDRVVPMLPERLSNDLCSLHPGGRKLCLSVFMEIDPDGNVRKKRLEETEIRSNRRCTYEEVQAWHERDRSSAAPTPEILALVDSAYELAEKIDRRREKEGRIDFDLPELKVELDASGEPLEIRERERVASHRLIETFMVIANEEISKSLSEFAPFIYRVHEPPSEEKNLELSELFASYGIRFPKSGARPKDVREAYSALKRIPNLPPVERLLLSKLSKARYSEKPLGHYGLALEYYTHFTSPIRRYPDLVAHRIIKDWIRKRLDSTEKTRLAAMLPEVANRCSETERRAEELERTVESFDSARYMERHIGESFDATVVGRSRYAYYVRLENGIEGAVYLGTKNGRGRVRESEFPAFGTRLRVRLVSVERAYGRIDFEPETAASGDRGDSGADSKKRLTRRGK